MKIYYFLLIFLPVFCGAQEETVVWKSLNGHSFKGAFVSLDEGMVTLEGNDGREISVPVAALDLDSQAMARTAAAESAKYQTLFTHSTSTANVEVRPMPNGNTLHITLMERARPIPFFSKIIVNVRHSEYRTNENGKFRHFTIPLQQVISVKTERKNALFRFLYENGVVIALKVTGYKDGVGFSYEMEEPPPGLPKLHVFMTSRFSGLLKYNPETKTYAGALSDTGVSYENLPALLEDYKMIVVDSIGREKIFGFYESPEKARGPEIILQTPAREDIHIVGDGGGTVISNFYGGRKVVEGFHIRYEPSLTEEQSTSEFSIRLR